METRKVQVTGKSTFVVSLPKKWVVKVNIHMGDSVALIPLPDGTLLVNPHLARKEKEHAKKTILVDEDVDQMQRSFVAAYLAGYNIVEFRSRSPINKELKSSIRKISKSVIGPEIVEEGDNSVMVRNLLDSSDFTFSKGIRRMHVVARDMHMVAMEALKTGRQDLADDVRERDDDVDKLYWMIAKQYNLVLRDVSFADRMGIRPQDALGYLLVARALERIADHAVRIANYSNDMKKRTDIVIKIQEASGNILTLLDDAANAFYKGRFDQAYEIVNNGREMAKLTMRLTQDAVAMHAESELSVPLAFIIDSLDRTRAYAVDIAETAINHIFCVQFGEDLMSHNLPKMDQVASIESNKR